MKKNPVCMSSKDLSLRIFSNRKNLRISLLLQLWFFVGGGGGREVRKIPSVCRQRIFSNKKSKDFSPSSALVLRWRRRREGCKKNPVCMSSKDLSIRIFSNRKNLRISLLLELRFFMRGGGGREVGGEYGGNLALHECPGHC